MVAVAASDGQSRSCARARHFRQRGGSRRGSGRAGADSPRSSRPRTSPDAGKMPYTERSVQRITGFRSGIAPAPIDPLVRSCRGQAAIGVREGAPAARCTCGRRRGIPVEPLAGTLRRGDSCHPPIPLANEERRPSWSPPKTRTPPTGPPAFRRRATTPLQVLHAGIAPAAAPVVARSPDGDGGFGPRGSSLLSSCLCLRRASRCSSSTLSERRWRARWRRGSRPPG